MTYEDDDRYLDGPLSRGPIPVEQANRELAELLARATSGHQTGCDYWNLGSCDCSGGAGVDGWTVE